MARRGPWLACALVAAVFLAGMLDFNRRKGGGPLRRFDAQSELNSWRGARRLLEDGPSATAFLPRYHPGINLESGSARVLASDVYTHFFPGPDYVMALAQAVLGAGPRTWQWARLVPLAQVLAATLVFLAVGHRRLWRAVPWATPILAGFLLFAPAMRPWSLSLHGHAYTSAYVLLGLALGAAGVTARRAWPWAVAAFSLGFLSNYMLLTAAFAVCAAPLAGGLLSAGDRFPRHALWSSVYVGLGLVAAFALHFAQVAAAFGVADALADQFGVAAARGGAALPEGALLRLPRLYSEDVYRFFGMAPLTMAALGLFAAWLHPGTRQRRLHLALATVVAAAGSWAWVFVMAGHSLEHRHVNPRVFLLAYGCCLAVLASLASAQAEAVLGRARPFADAHQNP